MTTAEQKGCYTHILFLFQILCYYFAHENRNYPFCSTCLFYIFNSDILHISETLPKCTVIVTATRTKSNPVLVFFTLIFVNINETIDFCCSLRSRQHASRNITGKRNDTFASFTDRCYNIFSNLHILQYFISTGGYFICHLSVHLM